MENILVGIADDHGLIREGIRLVVSQMSGVVLALEASDGDELLSMLDTTPVDIILLDIEMKRVGGIEALKKLRSMKHPAKVIMLSIHEEKKLISYLMKLGANAYLRKDAEKEEIEKAIRTVYDKKDYVDDHVAASLLDSLRTNQKAVMPGIDLSDREREVLELICREYTTKEIGEKLFISERTAEGHRKSICTKLNARNTAGMVMKAIELKLINSEEDRK